MLFGHHAINSLTNNVPDEARRPAPGVDDGHGHDQNPGCDVDPRVSTPIHLGEPSQRPPGDTTETLSELLLRYPHVIAFVAGHSHVNHVTPVRARRRRRRLLEHQDGRRGRLAGRRAA